MRVWRVIGFGLAILAFGLAAVGPDGILLFGATPERVSVWAAWRPSGSGWSSPWQQPGAGAAEEWAAGRWPVQAGPQTEGRRL